MTVLIIGSQKLEQCIREFLSDSDYSIDTIIASTSEQEAILFIRRHNPEIVFLQSNLRSVNSIELMRKALRMNCYLQFVLCGQLPQNAFMISALNTGAAYYLIVPIDRKSFNQAMKKVLRTIEYRAFPKVKTKVRSEFSAKANMKRACDTIEENYAEDYTLESVANMANMSISYFCAQFRLEKGISFKEYLLNLRISHAKDMLRNSDLSVNEISKRVGYDDANYFSKVFRKCEGCTPSEFREK